MLQVASLLQIPKRKLPDEPRSARAIGPELFKIDTPDEAQALGESADEAVADTPTLAVALRDLAGVVKSLAGLKQPERRSPLERALDGTETSTISDTGSGHGGTRSSAAAHLLLCRALTEQPTAISDPILDRMWEANRTSLGITTAASSARGSADVPDPLFYLEHRSRVTGFKTNVTWGWLMGCVAKALLQKRYDEALSRALLGIVACEQVSLEHGSWMTAMELQFSPEPPFASFEGHKGDHSRLPHSRLVDPRWNDVVLGRLSSLDQAIERRRRLDVKKPAPKTEAEPKRQPRPPKGGGKGKGKDQQEDQAE